jgi:hypothetical protein
MAAAMSDLDIEVLFMTTSKKRTRAVTLPALC